MSNKFLALWKKRGAKGDPKTYRPIALLPAVSRVVEKVLSYQLKAHLRAAGVIPDFQYGFQPGRNCEHAVTHLTSLIASARDRGETVLVASAERSRPRALLAAVATLEAAAPLQAALA